MDPNAKVTKEDQRFINEFSRLHQKNKAIDDELGIFKEKQENYKDALMACDELFGDNTRILIGETFIELPEDAARERIEKLKEEATEKEKELKKRHDLNKKRLDELKVILYSKFGKSINLDE